jgi:hypothetical protein
MAHAAVEDDAVAGLFREHLSMLQQMERAFARRPKHAAQQHGPPLEARRLNASRLGGTMDPAMLASL